LIVSNKIKLDEFIVVAGGGGFIGGELVRHLRQQGCRRIGAIDIKPLDEWFQRFPDVENAVGDLRDIAYCRSACRNETYIFNLADLSASLCVEPPRRGR
jgi:nucleoside-diphosphate-sugar epimerase